MATASPRPSRHAARRERARRPPPRPQHARSREGALRCAPPSAESAARQHSLHEREAARATAVAVPPWRRRSHAHLTTPRDPSEHRGPRRSSSERGAGRAPSDAYRRRPGAPHDDSRRWSSASSAAAVDTARRQRRHHALPATRRDPGEPSEHSASTRRREAGRAHRGGSQRASRPSAAAGRS